MVDRARVRGHRPRALDHHEGQSGAVHLLARRAGQSLRGLHGRRLGDHLDGASGADNRDAQPPGPSTEASSPSAPAASPAPVEINRLPLTVTQPVRSGQIVYARGGDLIVLAPVNPGAELMADGNIHVYAPLRGRAIAGAQGERRARIFCQKLEAELVGIDTAYLTSEDLPAHLRGKPVQVVFEKERCLILPL